MLRQSALSVTVIITTACSSLHDRLSRILLAPAAQWLVVPSDLGLDYEPFEIEAGLGSMTGWFLPADGANGRTVLLFHDNSANISMLHPYYTFLLEAGLNVCVFDYRGFGESKGEPSVRSAFLETPLVVEWLRQRPDVDKDRIAYYGLAFGSPVALNTAVREPCRALIVENVPGLIDTISASPEVQSSTTPSVSAGILAFGLPENVEAADNADKLSISSLWIAGADEPRDELRQTLRAYFEMGGDKQLWMLPGTGHAPHSLLTHDGEYQRAVTRFLRTALDGSPEQVSVAWQPGTTGLEESPWWSISLQRRGDPKGPWAVQVCALDAAGDPVFENTWLEGSASSVRMRLANQPQVIGAMHLSAVESYDDTTFRRVDTSLSRGGRWYERLADAMDELRHGQPTLAQVRLLASEITTREQIELFPALLESELADIYAIIGRMLANSHNAEDRAVGLIWLRRAVSAVPEHPDQHYWPGRTLVAGFPQRAQVDRARRLLEQRSGR